MRHNKPVAKIVALGAQATAATGPPPFVQRTFSMGAPLVDLTRLKYFAGLRYEIIG